MVSPVWRRRTSHFGIECPVSVRGPQAFCISQGSLEEQRLYNKYILLQKLLHRALCGSMDGPEVVACNWRDWVFGSGSLSSPSLAPRVWRIAGAPLGFSPCWKSEEAVSGMSVKDERLSSNKTDSVPSKKLKLNRRQHFPLWPLCIWVNAGRCCPLRRRVFPLS